MIFLSYKKNGKNCWGILKDDKVIESKEILGEKAPKSLLEYIQIGKWDIKLEDGIKGGEVQKKEILSPIVKPLRNIMCVGKNYKNHVLEMDVTGNDLQMVNKNPVFFTKGTNTINSPYGEIPSYKGLTSCLDYEGELAVVIGKNCTNLKEEEVMENIFGYTILNDITARDIQKGHKQWFRGKSLDKTCPMGPYLITKDEIKDPQSLKVETWINGEKRQDGNTKYMIRSIAKLISILSQGITLEAGDIIATGTPEGVGAGFDPPIFLKKNDIVKIRIEKLGYMENTIQDL